MDRSSKKVEPEMMRPISLGRALEKGVVNYQMPRVHTHRREVRPGSTSTRFQKVIVCSVQGHVSDHATDDQSSSKLQQCKGIITVLAFLAEPMNDLQEYLSYSSIK